MAEPRGFHHAEAYGGADGDVADHVGVANADHVPLSELITRRV